MRRCARPVQTEDAVQLVTVNVDEGGHAAIRVAAGDDGENGKQQHMRQLIEFSLCSDFCGFYHPSSPNGSITWSHVKPAARTILLASWAAASRSPAWSLPSIPNRSVGGAQGGGLCVQLFVRLERLAIVVRQIENHCLAADRDRSAALDAANLAPVVVPPPRRA
jgi:hypothetical protein